MLNFALTHPKQEINLLAVNETIAYETTIRVGQMGDASVVQYEVIDDPLVSQPDRKSVV